MNPLEIELKRLASFPEQNPNPVVELDHNTGQITYLNPAAKERFPELVRLGAVHSLLTGVGNLTHGTKREIQVDDEVFEQRIFKIPDSNLIRIYSNDISEQKRIHSSLLRLASFPELNPSPIIELNYDGEIKYTNPACRRIFYELIEKGMDHPVLESLRDLFSQLREEKIEGFSREIQIDDRYYSQHVLLLKQNQLIRIFNNDITDQKRIENLIKEKNKDITDSINYAQKIQCSLLPGDDKIHPELRNDYFVVYKPKDIISGDFYWHMPINDYFLFVCADCTGHGVPGALMSMLGSNTLSHVVLEKNTTLPHLVLQELDKRIIQTLNQSEDNKNRDGMDVAFCSFDLRKRILHYSGANRPLVIIREKKIIEYEPSKFPIGGRYDTPKIYKAEEIALQPNDHVYIFSDGITDQFGGPNAKKYGKKRFLEFLVSMQDLDIPNQKEKIFSEFLAWKGSLDQLDDICLLGLRVR